MRARVYVVYMCRVLVKEFHGKCSQHIMFILRYKTLENESENYALKHFIYYTILRISHVQFNPLACTAGS